jgi:hypothetical protein
MAGLVLLFPYARSLANLSKNVKCLRGTFTTENTHLKANVSSNI